MKKALLIFSALSLIFSVGCGGLRQNAVQLSQQDLANIEIAKEIAVNLLKAWPVKSGFIKGAMGPKLAELPQQALEAMNELDRLAVTPEALSDEEIGVSLGLGVRMLQQTVLTALEQFAPDVLQALTKVGLGL